MYISIPIVGSANAPPAPAVKSAMVVVVMGVVLVLSICVWYLRLVILFGSYVLYLCLLLVLVFNTCTFLGAPRLLAMHPKLAAKILLPEFCEPDVATVVGERAAPEVAIERCRGGTTRTSEHQNKPNALVKGF